MTIKERIEEILPARMAITDCNDVNIAYNDGIDDSFKNLEQAISEGKLCLDPPDEGEIYEILAKTFTGVADMIGVAEIISSRIRNGREE